MRSCRRPLFLALALLAACDRGDAAAEQAANGGAAPAAPAAPADPAAALPASLPLYPGATVTGTVVAAGGGRTLSFTSADAIGAVAAYYRRAAVTAGYALDAEVTGGDLAMLSGRRPGGADFSLTLVAAGAGSEGTLTAGTIAPAAAPAP